VLRRSRGANACGIVFAFLMWNGAQLCYNKVASLVLFTLAVHMPESLAMHCLSILFSCRQSSRSSRLNQSKLPLFQAAANKKFAMESTSRLNASALITTRSLFRANSPCCCLRFERDSFTFGSCFVSTIFENAGFCPSPIVPF
jgi:hypothetical protein